MNLLHILCRFKKYAELLFISLDSLTYVIFHSLSKLIEDQGFPGGSVVKNLPASARDRDAGSIPGLGRSPGGGNGNPLQCSCLENPTDRGAWRAPVCRVAKTQTEQTHYHTLVCQIPHQARSTT